MSVPGFGTGSLLIADGYFSVYGLIIDQTIDETVVYWFKANRLARYKNTDLTWKIGMGMYRLCEIMA